MNVFLVECTLDAGNNLPTVNVGSLGRYEFAPNPAYGGRRIIEVKSRAAVDAILDRNPAGRHTYIEPTDVLALQDEELVCRVVEKHFGIKRKTAAEPPAAPATAGEEEPAAVAEPPKPKAKRKRRRKTGDTK